LKNCIDAIFDEAVSARALVCGLSFSQMLKQWQDSTGHRANLLMAGARRVGVASVADPKSPYWKF
jgi:uncharacterized protein YkwD